MATVPQEQIDGLLKAFRAGDQTAADTLWDLQEFMTPEQRADTETKVHAISDEQEVETRKK
jgi:hypothetical protein